MSYDPSIRLNNNIQYVLNTLKTYGNVLTNPGGDWEYQYALKNPQYGLGMMGKMSDAQRNYLQAVSNDMGYNYNFTGATRFV